MKWFLLSVVLFFAACGKHVNDQVSQGDSPLGAGWFLIWVLFGALLPGFLIWQGKEKAKSGTYYYDESGKYHHDKTPQPWYKHGLSIAGVALAVITLIAVVIRVVTWG